MRLLLLCANNGIFVIYFILKSTVKPCPLFNSNRYFLIFGIIYMVKISCSVKKDFLQNFPKFATKTGIESFLLEIE